MPRLRLVYTGSLCRGLVSRGRLPARAVRPVPAACADIVEVGSWPRPGPGGLLTSQTRRHGVLVAAGHSHGLAAAVLDNDDGGNAPAVAALGLNSSGQLGAGTVSEDAWCGRMDTSTIPAGARIVGLAGMREASLLVVEHAGAAGAAGAAVYLCGRVGLAGGMDPVVRPAELAFGEPGARPYRIDCCASGLDHAVFATVARDGRRQAWAFGLAQDGQTGQGGGGGNDGNGGNDDDAVSDSLVPQEIAALADKHIARLASSTDSTLALLRAEDGTNQVWAWGNAEYRQFGGDAPAAADQIRSPIRLEPPVDDIVDLAAGGSFMLLLDGSGRLYSCGYAVLGQGPNRLTTDVPLRVPIDLPVSKCFASTGRDGCDRWIPSDTVDYAAAIDQAGDLWVFGFNNRDDKLGLGHIQHSLFPSKVRNEIEGSRWENAALGYNGMLLTMTV